MKFALILLAAYAWGLAAVGAGASQVLSPALVRDKLASEWHRAGVIELGDGGGWIVTRITSVSVSGYDVDVRFRVAPAAIPEAYPQR